ncbi:mechanosensitive ion channel family protein [Sansalvadorimonas verongulae]|uniref:mechanosensitive ion channel family protein n=1 Tax=Sansalvadorimonas verongulae TaxID=2172824 RepID=UPI0012BD074F|nr:mechanosensitive ion channel family protein [Sansalvadorimonas verongulae]MTI14310.1 mechanosensitive ion channel family protein [Sansalvadorimonas verongulae]
MTSFMETVQAWINAQGSWVVQAFIALVITAFVHFISSRFMGHLAQSLTKTKNLWDDTLLHAVRRPAVALIWVIGLMWVADIVREESGIALLRRVDAFYDLAVIIIVSWAAIRFIHEVESKIIRQDSSTVDETTASAISKLLRAVVIITSTLVVLQTMGYSISGILAFGGIGGIAIGFAAKDLLANFFGGMMIYLDRPFKVGDWIRSPDKNIEGTVEHIGWRQTRIRTFDKRPLYVPNATFSSISVENPSRMLNRRIKETIGLRYKDARTLPAVLEEVRGYLAKHEHIDGNQLMMVHFNNFGASSLDFFIYCFTKTCEWKRFHEVKEQVMIDILEIIHRHGADVAFPTRTLEMTNPDTVAVD